jgi:NADH-quinone oxidoreductase subunit C
VRRLEKNNAGFVDVASPFEPVRNGTMTTEGATAESASDPVAGKFTGLFPSLFLETGQNAMGETTLSLAPENVLFVLRQAKDVPELGFDFFRCLTGVDQMDQGIEIIYSLFSYKNRHCVHIKTMLPAVGGAVDSVTSVWAGADWHERETAEMFGVTFTGHPNPKHLLLDDDMEIHPLLKAHPLAPIELKQGVDTF